MIVLVVLTALQRKLIFYPTRTSEAKAIADGESVGLEPWRSARGEFIGWKSKRPNAGTSHKLLILHGNAGSAVHRFSYVHAFQAVSGTSWDARILEYPGYGPRPGEPSRDAFAVAGRAALEDWAAAREPVFLLGESVGCGVACDLAANEASSVAGLILITPFARLADVARMHFPFLPVGLLLKDRWDNVAALKTFEKPVAVLIAGRDEIVGAAQGQLLFDGLRCRKQRWLFPDATHNDLEIQSGQWAGEVSKFLLPSPPIKR